MKTAATIASVIWDRWFQKLGKLSDLSAGWDGYDPPVPTQVAIDNAGTFLEALQEANLPPNILSPSSVGGIGVTFESSGREAYVEFYNDGRAYLLLSDGNEAPQISNIGAGAEAFEAAIHEIRGYLDGRSSSRDVAQ